MSEMMYVLAASYDDVDRALADYQAIDAAYRHVGSTHDFDATVVARDSTGEVQIVRRHDEPTRHATGAGLGWGLAAGAVAALFPAVGILGALAAGGGTGAALGAMAGHAARAMSRDDLKTLGEVLDRGDAGLVVVYGPDMADRIATSLSGAKHKVQTTTSVSPEAFAARIRSAQAEESASPDRA
ncbi:DUF1269 domain-containing protein [Candidatus Solirubrobacter pratensis]|uniref:DUF1269 domain-containing protein n=1 Tax=Candidatus Solirubrobacter pratensis TaxID=1298857 RepID=UPI000408A6B4|nr:DUF1269 domain-containing protein [Candidatus Solirubrobacter pratensis]